MGFDGKFDAKIDVKFDADFAPEFSEERTEAVRVGRDRATLCLCSTCFGATPFQWRAFSAVHSC